MTKENGQSIETHTPLIEAAGAIDLHEDLDRFNQHRQGDYEDAMKALQEKFSRMGIQYLPGEQIRSAGELLSTTYNNILNHTRQGSNVSLAILRTLNKLAPKASDNLLSRLDQAHTLSKEMLKAIRGDGGRFGLVRPDKSVAEVASIGIFEPYTPTLELIVNSKGQTKKLLQNLDAETKKTAGKAEAISKKLTGLTRETQLHAEKHDTLLPALESHDEDRMKVFDHQDRVIEAAASKNPLSEPVKELTQQIVASTKNAELAIKANNRLKEVLQKIAIMGSLQAEQAALVRGHRTGVISLGVESSIHTTLPFTMAEVIVSEIERMQLLNLHIMLQIQRAMLGGHNPDEVLRNGVAPRVLTPEGAKNIIIDSVARDARP